MSQNHRNRNLPRWFSTYGFTPVLLLFFCARLYGAEYLQAETVAPKRAHDTSAAISAEFDEKEKQRSRLIDILKKRRATSNSFRRDATIHFKPRLYDFERQPFAGYDDGLSTGGASIEYRSGKWRDLVSVGLTHASSFEINNRKNNGSLGLLTSNGHDISVFSEAYVRISDTEQNVSATLFRQSFNLPYLNRQDSKMVPNTFDAVRVDYRKDSINVVIAQVNKFKPRDSEHFIQMSRAAGTNDSSNELMLAGARYELGPWEIGAVDLYTKDLMNILYLESRYRGSFHDEIDFQIAGQFTKQTSIGAEEIGTIDTWHWGATLISSWRHVVLSLNYTDTDDSGSLISPWGGRPHFNSLMLEDFDRAGEQSHGIGISYTLDRWGLPSLSMTLKYVEGDVASNNNQLFDQREMDFTLDYKPQNNLNNLWLRFRYAEASRNGETRRDIRLIFNYPLQLI
jgi:hypothetical protein